MNRFILNVESRHTTFLVKSFLIFSIFYFFSSIFFGVDFTDSFYHLNQALAPADNIYLYPFFLSSIIIKGLVGIVGQEIIYLRFFNSLILFFSILMPFFLIKVKKPRAEALFYIAIGLFLFTPFNVNILGYDSISIFILSLIFSLSVYYLQKPGLYLLLLLSFISAAAVLIRLPNIGVIPIVFFAIIFSTRLHKSYFSGKHPILYLLLSLSIVCLAFTLYYSNINGFFNASAISSSHDFKILLHNYYLHGQKLLLFIFFILGGCFLFNKGINKMPKIFYYILACIFFIIFFSLFVIRSKFSQNYSLFLTSLTFSIVITLVYKNGRPWLSTQNLILYSYLLFLFINPFGSNTGLLKAASLFLLLPFVISSQSWKPDKYWKLLLIVLVPFSLIENISSTYEDRSLPAMSSQLQINLLKPIRTSATRANFLHHIDTEIEKLQDRDIQVFFYGDKSHIFHYLYPETSLNIASFFQPVDELIYYTEIKEKIVNNGRVAIFIVDSYPHQQKLKQHKLEKKLLEDGFKKTVEGSLTYFIRINN